MSRAINRIIIHYSNTPETWYAARSLAEKHAEIDRWHREERGWSGGFGYHRLIDRDGAVMQGRPFERAGAHAVGHNADSIGICYIGNSRPTQAQFVTLERECSDLQARYGIPDSGVIGHRDVGATLCPGFDVPEWWALRRRFAGTAI